MTTASAKKKNAPRSRRLPLHPGKIVHKYCLRPSRLTVEAAAELMGVSCQSFSDLIDGKRGISLEMAIGLSKAFGSTPQVWIELQREYDLVQAIVCPLDNSAKSAGLDL